MGKTTKRKTTSPKGILLLTSLVLLSSCSLYSMWNRDSTPLSNIDPIDPSSLDEDKDGVYQPKDGELIPFNYTDLCRSRGADTVISKGKSNILVVPIEFTDYPFTSTFTEDLEACLYGQDGDERLYSSSLASFYKKSSFGKLDLQFTVAPIYKTGYTAKTAYTRSLDNGAQLGLSASDNGIYLVSAAVEKAKQSNKYNFKDFDVDGNGSIDGVIAVYSCHTSRADESLKAYDKDDFFWAYTFWALQNPNKSSPTLNTYFWMSVDFIYKEDKEEGTKLLDAHTLTHEFGHMMGLDDYYIAHDCQIEEMKKFNPLGMLDMMDGNILDHNAFSKAAMGWENPKVVYDSCTIKLGKATTTGDSFIIPTSHWNGTIFDEYFMVEFYTPDELNEKDTKEAYPNRPRGFTVPGIKIYHVDARVEAVDYRFNTSGQLINETHTYYNGYKIEADKQGYERRFFQTAASNNSKSTSQQDYHFSLIHLIEGSGMNTFAGGLPATDDCLFQAGDEFELSLRKTGALKTFGQTFMPKENTFNNGDPFPFNIKISEIGESEAAIVVTKQA